MLFKVSSHVFTIFLDEIKSFISKIQITSFQNKWKDKTQSFEYGGMEGELIKKRLKLVIHFEYTNCHHPKQM
jgi:hypothetical protein